MAKIHPLFLIVALVLSAPAARAQVTTGLPGRTIVKLTPDYVRPVVYALNSADGVNPGTVVALNATNGAVMNEIAVGVDPTDMTLTQAGDAMYVINTGSRTISKVDLASFTVESSRPITTPLTYSLSNPLYIVADNYGTVYFTDGAWGPEVYSFDYADTNETMVLGTGGNEYPGVGGMVLSKDGSILYCWQQYGWSAGSIDSAIIAYSPSSLTTLSVSPNQNRDPLDTPIFLDGAERWVFNKVEKVSATNAAVLLTQFTDNIYAISLDGSVAFGPTEVFNAESGALITNMPFSTDVQSLSGDQKELFRYNASDDTVVVYDMASIFPVSGLAIVPTPADGSVVGQAPASLAWSPWATALSYDVYFGSSASAVASATAASPLYLGRTTSTSIAPGQQLNPGATYYWRVDAVGFSATTPGQVWSFTVSSIAVTPTQIPVGSIVGYNPANVSLTLSSATSQSWSAAVTGGTWVTLSASNGTAPATVILSFSTASFSVGTYTNNIEFTAGGLKVEEPLTLTVSAMNIVKMAADRVRPYIYALQPPLLSGQNGTLLFINTDTGNIDKTLPIGINPTDLTVHYAENRLYIASWGENATYVVDLNTQSLLPSLHLGTDIYKINAGRAGRIVTEGEDQWIGVNLIDTASGDVAGSFPYPEREGDGESDPTGGVYYHCDNDISDANIHKFIMTSDAPSEVADSNEHPYGTRNLVLSPDGTRLFWNGYEFDSNLNELGSVGTEIYCCNSNGSVAFGGNVAIDGAARQVIYNLPVNSGVSVVDGKNQDFWYYNSASGSLGRVPMATVESPSITTQPAATTSAEAGSSVYLSVSAMGLGPLFYQWTFDGSKIPGATNYFLSLPSLQLAQQGSYQVIVSNAVSNAISLVASVTVLYPPTITSQPTSVAVAAGQTIDLSIQANGSAPLTYTWTFDNQVIALATNSSLLITNAQEANGGVYQVSVNNAVGSAASSAMLVRVDPAGPTIAGNPASQTLPASSNAVFAVTALGSEPLSYQWFFEGSPIPGASARQYALTNIQLANSGRYDVIVSNSLGAATSVVASLTVTALAPYFTVQPAAAAAGGGSNVTFHAIANGSQPITYQWQHDGTNLPGAGQSSLTLSNLSYSESGSYAVIAANTAGATTSSVAQLTVYQIPTLMAALTNQVVDAGANVSLAVTVLGSPVLSYSWQLNGRPIAGSGATLALSNIQPWQTGFYSVTVTNAFGSVSSTGRVSVLPPVATVVAWGDNSGGQLNVPASLTNAVSVAGGDYHSVALRHDGTLLAWGYDGNGQTDAPTNMLPYVTVASGADHNLAITENGGVVAWGRNDAGQCDVPITASNGILAVAAGDSHSVALSGSGQVTAWGDDTFGQIDVPKGLSGVTAIAAGRDDCLAVQANGTVTGWGYNAYGQAAPPLHLSNVVAVACGYLHSAALLNNGTVVAWGDDSFGQTNVPAGLTNVLAIKAGDFNTLALLASGRVVSWGDNSFGQGNVPEGLTNATMIAAGYYHGLAMAQTAGLVSANLSTQGLILTWTGHAMLQWASSPTGPYTDVPAAGTAFTNTDLTAPEKFYRLRK